MVERRYAIMVLPVSSKGGRYGALDMVVAEETRYLGRWRQQAVLSNQHLPCTIKESPSSGYHREIFSLNNLPYLYHITYVSAVPHDSYLGGASNTILQQS
jgi:hypothetical protein